MLSYGRVRYSIPELVSHICTHLKGQETLGLEATEKCLQQYPANEPMKRNQRFFQNRIGKVKEVAHHSLE